jgi:dTDP-4-amino-4,6-dideoxygalactose transaminase
VDYQSFRIGFDEQDKARVFEYWNEIFADQKWSHARFTKQFEEKWTAWNGISAVAFASWTGGALACMEYFGLRGKKILCPTNTFMATPLAIEKAGGEVIFADCNCTDLCLSYDAVVAAAAEHDVAAIWLVHIGGHIAFDSLRIAEFCRARGIILLEDCAHAHGASWHGQKPGTYGDAGVYSFYATKTISTGEGGMLVSRHANLLEFARQFRDYGKPGYRVAGLNYRMSEFTAALGVVQVDRLPAIVEWKNEIATRHLDLCFNDRVRLPDGMVSGFYKYIVFQPIEKSTGKVYDEPCHRLMGRPGEFPNAEWISRHHWCVPLYYHPELRPEHVRERIGV